MNEEITLEMNPAKTNVLGKVQLKRVWQAL
jgi:hypothetical protein